MCFVTLSIVTKLHLFEPTGILHNMCTSDEFDFVLTYFKYTSIPVRTHFLQTQITMKYNNDTRSKTTTEGSGFNRYFVVGTMYNNTYMLYCTELLFFVNKNEFFFNAPKFFMWKQFLCCPHGIYAQHGRRLTLGERSGGETQREGPPFRRND